MIIVFSPMLRITNHPKCSRQYLKYTNEDKIYILCRLILLWLTSLLHMKGNRYLENFSFFHSNCICLHLVVTGCRLHDAFYEPRCDYSLQETDKEGRLFFPPPSSIDHHHQMSKCPTFLSSVFVGIIQTFLAKPEFIFLSSPLIFRNSFIEYHV